MGILFALLVGPAAADRAKDQRPHMMLISIMKDVPQALVKDHRENQYVLLREGDIVRNTQVMSVHRSHVIVRVFPDRYGNQPIEYILRVKEAAKAIRSRAAKDRLYLLDPYGRNYDPRTGADRGLIDPYGRDPYGRVPRSVPAPPVPNYPPPQVQHQPLPPRVKTPPRKQSSYVIPQREFDSMIADFYRVSREIQTRQTARGLRILGVSRGSLFYRLGLRKGDIVRVVAGVVLRNVDDGAHAYERVMRLPLFSVELTRKGVNRTLHYRFDSAAIDSALE